MCPERWNTNIDTFSFSAPAGDTIHIATQVRKKAFPFPWLTWVIHWETREGWPLPTVETEVSGDSKSTNERGPFLVNSLDLILFDTILFQLICHHRQQAGRQSCWVNCLLVCVSGDTKGNWSGDRAQPEQNLIFRWIVISPLFQKSPICVMATTVFRTRVHCTDLQTNPDLVPALCFSL